MILIIVSFITVIFLFIFLISEWISPKKFDMVNAHVLITGASSGIGKSLAMEAVKKGANVSLLARNKERLLETKDECKKYMKNPNQKIQCISCDISSDYDIVNVNIKKAIENFGAISMLINCAGASISGVFEDIDILEFERMIKVNYIGSVYVTRAALPSLKNNSNSRIVFVSSMAGQTGLFGYTAYSASKFALRGFAECLQMELLPYNIRITLAHPPDTNTPGFVEENKFKPKETLLLSESAGVYESSTVAKSIIIDAIRGKFLNSIGLDGFMLNVLTSGFSPVTSILEATQQVGLMGIFRAISMVYLDYFNRIVMRCHREKTGKKIK